MNNQELNVKQNKKSHRFEINFGEDSAFIEYQEIGDNVIAMTHTEVPPRFEGQGVGSKLVKDSLEMVKAEGKKVDPLCPFVAAYIERHPEYKSVVA